MSHAIASAPSPLPGTYWVTDRLFLAGPFPGQGEWSVAESRIRTLRTLGIKRIVDLTEESESFRCDARYPSEMDSSGLAVERYAIRDRQIPKVPTMVAALDAIDASIGRDAPVYLHCWAGLGRTGTAVGCWLIRHGYADPTNVFSVLDHLRSQDTERGTRASPETVAQKAFVSSWSLDQ